MTPNFDSSTLQPFEPQAEQTFVQPPDISTQMGSLRSLFKGEEAGGFDNKPFKEKKGKSQKIKAEKLREGHEENEDWLEACLHWAGVDLEDFEWILREIHSIWGAL